MRKNTKDQKTIKKMCVQITALNNKLRTVDLDQNFLEAIDQLAKVAKILQINSFKMALIQAVRENTNDPKNTKMLEIFEALEKLS